MRQHLHLGHVLREERNVMPDERLQPLLWIACRRDRLPRAFQDLCEATLLDQRKQVFLAPDVVVHPRQGHPARGGEVPHGGGVVALVRKDPGGAGEQVVETLVVWSHDFERLFEIASYGDRLLRARLLIFGTQPRPYARSPMAQPHMVPAAHDTALIAAWQAGDEQAAAELVRRHARPLARFLAGAGAPDAAADDLGQRAEGFRTACGAAQSDAVG